MTGIEYVGIDFDVITTRQLRTEKESLLFAVGIFFLFEYGVTGFSDDVKLENRHLLPEINSKFNLFTEHSKAIKNQQIESAGYSEYMETSHYKECMDSNPIDLSRRRDSVETRKTRSPSDSSILGSTSPNILNDSPSTASLNISGGRSSSNSAVHPSSHQRSETPPHHYPSATYMQLFRHPQGAFYPYQSKRNDCPSPPDNLTAAMHHHHMHDYADVSSQMASGTAEEINPYILHALQQKLVQSQMMENRMSDESPAIASINMQAMSVPDATPFPMVVGRDGKVSRPFKAYTRDPFNRSKSLPVTDSLIGCSDEKYQAFRKQMFDQIHAANGGHPTISNPKMRRSSAKTFVDNMATAISDDDQPHRDHELMLQQQHQQQQQQDNNTLSDSLSNDGSNKNGSNAKSGTYKDPAYFERRKKNNAAAKKSRDRRRIKEDELAIRAAFLERENLQLRSELKSSKHQLAQILGRSMHNA